MARHFEYPEAVKGVKRRHVPPKGRKGPIVLPETHRAIVEGRTLFPTRVFSPLDRKRVLIDGVNNRKLGSHVAVGDWKGMPQFTLTLEERATCDRGCPQWRCCFGNQTHAGIRFEAGPELEGSLRRELHALSRQHRYGFVVRLHVLGDFYSVAYVKLWLDMLAELPNLFVWGYTNRRPGTPIGGALKAARDLVWHRFAVRLSNGRGDPKTVNVVRDLASAERLAEKVGGRVCPYETGKVASCGNCGLCWTQTKPIIFIEH